MGSYKKLIKNTGVFFIANFGSKVLTFLLVRFYTELLSTAEYGRIDLLNTTVSLAIPLVTLCITEAVLRFSIDDIDHRSTILTDGLLVTVVGSILFIASAPVFWYANILKNDLVWLYLLTVSNSIFTVISHFSRGIGKSKLFALSGLAHTFFQIGLNLIFLLQFRMGIRGYLISSVMANVLSFLFVFIAGRLWKYVSFSIDRIYLKKMIAYSAPLIPNSVFWWIMQSSDRYVISYILTESDNGLYAVANKIPTIISTISTIFFQAWQLSSVEEAKSKDKDKFYTNVFKIFSMLLILSSSLLLVFLRPIFRILVEKSYYSGWTCTPFLLCAMMFSCFSSFLGTNYVAMKKTKGVFLTTVVGAVVNIILNIVLTPTMGIRGTALATFASFAITWLTRLVDTRSFVKIHYSFLNFVIPLLLVILQSVFLSFGIESYIYQVVIFGSILLIYSKQLLVLLKKVIDYGKRLLHY